jgi:hypothetical protein
VRNRDSKRLTTASCIALKLLNATIPILFLLSVVGDEDGKIKRAELGRVGGNWPGSKLYVKMFQVKVRSRPGE